MSAAKSSRRAVAAASKVGSVDMIRSANRAMFRAGGGMRRRCYLKTFLIGNIFGARHGATWRRASSRQAFIMRKREFDHATRRWVTDLRFDASNAQGTFKTTANAAA